MGKSKKSDGQDKLTICTYLPSIILYSIDVQNPTSEYYPIREYYGICSIMSQIAWNLYKHVTNSFNVHEIFSIDTKLYTCEVRAYNMEYLSGACLIARVGRASVVS